MCTETATVISSTFFFTFMFQLLLRIIITIYVWAVAKMWFKIQTPIVAPTINSKKKLDKIMHIAEAIHSTIINCF